MTKKKRELIEILLDNVKPEDWPESLPYAAQDKCDSAVYVYSGIPDITSIYNGCWHPGSLDCKFIKTVDVICKFWNKTIVHRDEFMKRWNERNPVVDSEGWIQWNGGEMPVEKGALIDVKYRDGLINLHVIAGFGGCSTGSIKHKCAINFNHSGRSVDIIAYRLHVPQEQKTPQQLALEKFGTDWHENNGETPLLPAVVKIDIEFSNGTIRTGRDSDESSFEIPFDGNEGYTVTRWRIHSETDTTTPPAQQEAHTEETKPIQQEVKATDTQVGGDHYTKLAIQPMQYSMKNKLDPLQHTIIKYVTRFRDKAGIEDLEKAKHCIDMLIEYEKESK